MQEARKPTGVKINTWQEMGQVIARAKRKDNQRYSTTNVNINCPRTMSKRNYFLGGRHIQDYTHKINHMVHDKN